VECLAERIARRGIIGFGPEKSEQGIAAMKPAGAGRGEENE
jgi:hypothetical protein